jgi:hypothetical protein
MTFQPSEQDIDSQNADEREQKEVCIGTELYTIPRRTNTHGSYEHKLRFSGSLCTSKFKIMCLQLAKSKRNKYTQDDNTRTIWPPPTNASMNHPLPLWSNCLHANRRDHSNPNLDAKHTI